VKFPAKRLDATAMADATARAQRYRDDLLTRAEAMRADPARLERRASGLCGRCHYGAARIGGAAMVMQPCAACWVEQRSGSTNTDALCQPCADRHDLCKHCGGDREMRSSRRDWPAFPSGGPRPASEGR